MEELEDDVLRSAAGLVVAAVKLGVPKIFDLVNDPTQEYGATATPSAWVDGPMMKIVVELEQSLKKYPPIASGTPDPDRPPTGGI